MDIKSLMIGDWVIVNDIEHTHPLQVTELFMKSGTLYVTLYWDGMPEDAMPETLNADVDKVLPIPLTPEILKKNGWKHEFDKTDYMVKYNLGEKGKDCWMMWAIKEHNLDIQRQDEKLDMYNLKVSKVVIPCDYVHELQHAMCICGIEKTIEL